MILLKRLATAALCIVLLSAAGPTIAAPQPQTAPTRQQQAQMDAMQTWMSDVAIWGQRYTEVTTRRSATLLWMIGQSEVLIAHLAEGDEVVVRAWTTAWAKTVRERLGSEMMAYQALSTTLPPVPTSLEVDAASRRLVAQMALAPDRTGAMLIHSGQAAETYLQVAEATRAGDEEGLLRLGGAMFILMAANIDAEINMMEGLRGQGDDPAYFWRGAMIENNHAIKIWMLHQKAIIFEEPADADDVARRIGAHAQQARTDADAMDKGTREVLRSMRAEPAMQGSAFASNLEIILASMLESADVERLIAGELETLADAVRRGDSEAVDAPLSRFETLVDRRIQIDRQRRARMAASGG